MTMNLHDKRLTSQIRFLLFEAYRRLDMISTDYIQEGKPITKRWVGLGTEAAFRPAIEAGLMHWFDDEQPPPRCKGWLCLTELGVTVLWDHRAEFEKMLQGLKEDSRYQRSTVSQFTLAGGLSSA